MTVKQVRNFAILAGATVALSGCRSELCPESRRLADEARRMEPGSPVHLQRLEAAIDSYRQCRQAKAKSDDACALIDRELANLTGTYARLKLAQIAGGPCRTIPEFDAVILDLERAVRYDGPNGSLRKALRDRQDARAKLVEEVQRLLGAAVENKSSQRWQEAVSALDAALAIDPENREALRIRAETISDRNAHYRQTIQQLCQEDNYDSCARAVSVLEAFRAEKPAPDGKVISDLQNLVEQTAQKMAEQLIQQKKYFSAYAIIKEINTPKREDLMKVIVEQGGPFYMALANEEYRNVRDFHAYAAAVKALELLGSENDQAFKLHRDCSDHVDDSIQMRIGIAPFRSSGDEADIGIRFANELLGHLHPLLPYGVAFEEREKIEFGIEKVGSTESVRLLGLKWAVFGDVACTVLRDRDTREVTAWARVWKTIPNPQYETELRAIAEAGKNRAALPRPQPTIQAKVSEKIEYTAGEERINGQIACSARIYSADESYVTSPVNFTIDREAKDLFFDTVPDANITGDPLELPSQLAFVGEMRKEMIAKVGEWLLANLANRQRRFYEEAERFVARKEYDQAVRVAAQGYLYCLRDKVAADDAWFRKLRKLTLFDLTETPSP